MIRYFLKYITNPFFKLWFRYYHSKPRYYSYNSLKIKVMPGVFSPKFTFSTRLLLEYLKPLELAGKHFLELGCGSGIIALLAAQKRAIVTASDINSIALAQLKISAKENKLHLNIIASDLFDAIPPFTFDYICINPPYYPKTPQNISEKAWFCGENFEYFQKLFKQLPIYINKHSEVIMILSQDCDIDKIKSIANQNKCLLKRDKKINSFLETNYIFKLKALE